MDDKLKVFKAVARNKSFTKAAKVLNLSQPAVSKTIKTLEREYGRAFFVRQGNHIKITSEGQVFLEYVDKLLQLYKQAQEELRMDDHYLMDNIVIGASTTIANYIIPELMAQLQKEKRDLHFELFTGNTHTIQEMVLANHLDFGIVEGKNQNSRLAYQKFLKDELVLVTRVQNKSHSSGRITAQQLKTLTYVNRENGSGTRQVIENALRDRGIKQRANHLVMGSTESIKTYLYHSDCFAFLSIHAVRRDLLENRLRLIDIEDLQIDRWFYIITRQGFSSHTAKTLGRLLKKAYNKR